MFDFEFDHIERKLPGVVADYAAPSLWILHADKVPPHAGLSVGNRFYSIKVNGRDHGLELRHLTTLISQKQIPTFRVELVTALDENKVRSVFDTHKSVVPGVASCLAPIKISLNYPDVSRLAELLRELKTDNQIKTVHAYNVDEDIKGIRFYSVRDINSHLQELLDEK